VGKRNSVESTWWTARRSDDDGGVETISRRTMAFEVRSRGTSEVSRRVRGERTRCRSKAFGEAASVGAVGVKDHQASARVVRWRPETMSERVERGVEASEKSVGVNSKVELIVYDDEELMVVSVEIGNSVNDGPKGGQ